MIITQAYRKFHTELEDFHAYTSAHLDGLPEDYLYTLIKVVDALDDLTGLCEGDDKITMLLDTDVRMLNSLITMLSGNPDYEQAVDVLKDLASCPVSATVFEQQVRDFKEEVVFSETYGFDGNYEFGAELMDRHLRGLEIVHETEMTPRAFYDLEDSLKAFQTYLSWFPEIGSNPFDTENITDHYVRLARLVRGK